MRLRPFFSLAAIAVLGLSALAEAESVVLHVPASPAVKAASIQASGVMSGAASTQPATAGVIDGATVHFPSLIAGKPYDIALTLADGRIIQGVNLSWMNEEKTDPANQPLSDDDRAQIAQFMQPGKDFFDKIDLLQLAGDRNHAVGLVRQIRDSAFHSDSGGEVIARFELWYFRFEYGGWEKVQQGQRVLRRDRFPNQAAYEKAIKPIRWTPQLGGVRVDRGKDANITLSAWPAEPTTAPSASPSPS